MPCCGRCALQGGALMQQGPPATGTHGQEGHPPQLAAEVSQGPSCCVSRPQPSVCSDSRYVKDVMSSVSCCHAAFKCHGCPVPCPADIHLCLVLSWRRCPQSAVFRLGRETRSWIVRRQVRLAGACMGSGLRAHGWLLGGWMQAPVYI